MNIDFPWTANGNPLDFSFGLFIDANHFMNQIVSCLILSIKFSFLHNFTIFIHPSILHKGATDIKTKIHKTTPFLIYLYGKSAFDNWQSLLFLVQFLIFQKKIPN